MPVLVQQLQVRYVVYPKQSNDIFIGGVQDSDSGLFLNAMQMQATLYDEFSNAVPGAIAIPMVYQALSNGDYLGSFGDPTFQPVIGSGYTMIIDGGQGAVSMHLEIPTEVRVRQS